MMKWFKFRMIAAAALAAGSLTATPIAHAQRRIDVLGEVQDCTDRVTGGGYIVRGARPAGFAGFGAGGGLLHGDLTGYLNFVDHDPATDVRHVSAQTVVAYCAGCFATCRQITYSPATVDGVEVDRVIVEVCDAGEPGGDDTFSVCVPSLGYCFGGILGGDDRPGGGSIQLPAPDPGCGPPTRSCNPLAQCPCFLHCR